MVGYNSDLLDVDNDISSRIGRVKVEGSNDRGNDQLTCSLHGTVSSERRQCGNMDAARRDASI